MLLAKPRQTAVARKIEHTQRLIALEDLAKEEGLTVDHEDMVQHFHCNGAYARAFSLPKGMWCTGEVHRFACINIVAKGHLKVAQSDGNKELFAGDIYISTPGEKKALYAFEDSVFVNIHATEETDQDILREHFVVPREELLEYSSTLKLEDF